MPNLTNVHWVIVTFSLSRLVLNNDVINPYKLSFFVYRVIRILPSLREVTIVPDISVMRKAVGDIPQLSLLFVLEKK